MTARQTIFSIVVAAIVMFVLPVFFDVLNLTTFAAYALLALSLGFVWGYGGILCFGQTAFYGLGAYVYAMTAINTGEAWSGVLLAIVIPAAFAAVLGAMMFYRPAERRLSGRRDPGGEPDPVPLHEHHGGRAVHHRQGPDGRLQRHPGLSDAPHPRRSGSLYLR